MKHPIMGLALTACLVHSGCDSNPGGPSAPSAPAVSSSDAVNSSPAAANVRAKKKGSGGSVAPISATD